MADNSADRSAARTPAEIRRDGNRLRDEPSLYLRQHAHNPLDWRPWGQEALAAATAEDKPIFLSIGYASCHWCHVMEREVFDDDEVAALMNRFFVCIKLDREERPDLDAVYMEAVQTLTGQGGWPLSVFLTPAGQPFFGGTYFPRDRFLALANRVREVYAENRDELRQQAAQVAARIAALPEQAARNERGTAVDAQLVARAAEQAPVQFDLKWGGFDAEQKFPVPARWQFLLHHHRKTGDARHARLVELTLAAMASGGIYDHVGGGFHRYTVERTWLIPHFEKMLYDNAQLASLYLEAGMALERPEFLAVGRDVLDFLLREMRLPDGAFGASFDADSGGEEGSYYVWDADDLALAAGGDDARVLADLLGVSPEGNFERGKSVLTRRADVARVAREHERDTAEVEGLFNRRREALRAHRDRRARPSFDPKVIASWNGMAIAALAQGYAVTGEERFRDAAVGAADYLWRIHMRPDGALARTSHDGVAGADGVLDDYGFLAGGLLDLYQITGEVEQLRRALALIATARERFAAPDGGFYLTPAGIESPLGRKLELFDSVIPSGNAALLQALLRGAAVTGSEVWRADVARALDRHAELMRRAGLEMAWWHDVALRYLGPFHEVVVAGDPGDPAAAELAAAVIGALPPHAVLLRVPAAGASGLLADLAPPAAGKTAPDGRAVAYVCRHGACEAPVATAAEVTALLRREWPR